MKKRMARVKRMTAWMLVLVLLCSIVPQAQKVNAQSKSENYNKSYSLNGDGAHDIVAVARAQAGKTKAQLGFTEAWCADYVSDCAKLAGVGNVIPFNCNCGSLRNAILKAGGRAVSSPQAGDIVFYWCKYCSRYVHTAIMISGSLSIQGNYGGKVTDNVKPTVYQHGSGHSVASGTVSVSYVRPAYKSAVPVKDPFCFHVDSAPAEGATFYSPSDVFAWGGWVLTTYGKGLVTCVNLCVNGKDIQNSERVQRSDVENVYRGNYNCADTGFQGSINADILSPGKNTISLRAYATNVNQNDILIGDFWETTVYYYPDSNLNGCLDSVKGGKGTITFEGWGYNKNNNENVSVHIYKDGAAGIGSLIYAVTADQERKDVANAFGIADNHGFRVTVPVDCAGQHTFHFYIVSANGAGNKYIGNKTVFIEENKAPIGVFDIAIGGTDILKARGWMYDPDSEDSIPAHLYVDGPAGTGKFIGSFIADKERKDVAESEHVGNYHGFDEEIKLGELEGEHTFYIHAIDTDGGSSTVIGSKTVNIKKGSSPMGVIDSLKGVKGGVSLRGWSIDKDAVSKAVTLHVYIGGHIYVIHADKERPDVEREIGMGRFHGFNEIIAATERGEQEVYVYALDEGSNQPNILLGHGTVVIEETDIQEEHVHEYAEEITKPAACNAEGEKCFTCTCGSTYREIIEKIPHTPVIDKSMKATCTADGLTEGSHCSECGEIIKAQEIIPKTGHKDTVVKYEKAASCVSAGYTGDIFCMECGQIAKEGEFTKQLEHTMGEGIVLKAATETEAGVTIFTCTVCQSMGVKIIPAIGSENLKENTSHGHEYITTEVIKEPTYNSPGSKVHACACGEYLEEAMPAKAFQEKAPVETEGSIGTVPDNESEGGEKTDIIDNLPEEKEDITDRSSVKDGKEDEESDRNIMEQAPKKAVITYRLSGGKNNKKNPQSCSSGKVVLKNPTRKGYAFVGWYLDSKFKKKITVIYGESNKNITLYAKWNKVTVKRAAVKKTARTGKKLKVTISKTSGAEGYIVQCSADKKFRKGVKNIKTRDTSVTFTKLKKGRMYVRVRAYKTDSASNRIYGAYSRITEVKDRK